MWTCYNYNTYWTKWINTKTNNNINRELAKWNWEGIYKYNTYCISIKILKKIISIVVCCCWVGTKRNLIYGLGKLAKVGLEWQSNDEQTNISPKESSQRAERADRGLVRLGLSRERADRARFTDRFLLRSAFLFFLTPNGNLFVGFQNIHGRLI